MADSEFEEFRYYFERLPQQLQAPICNYRLVHDVALDESPTSPTWPTSSGASPSSPERSQPRPTDSEDEEIDLHHEERVSEADSDECAQTCCASMLLADSDFSLFGAKSLAEELGAASDSGHSSAHSPEASCSPALAFARAELLEATHRGLHKFVARHADELDLEIGDPIYVHKEAEDLWCEGLNLRSGRQGVFPSAYAVDLDYSDFDPAAPRPRRERYLLAYLGSVETLAHKGTPLVCQAVRRVLERRPRARSCVLEVSDQGLRMLERARKPAARGPAPLDCFYALKNVSFCAFHPRQQRYLGFVTKHPTLQRFACHVFAGQESTRPVAEAVGRAFHRFYTKFIETAFPLEDIYIE